MNESIKRVCRQCGTTFVVSITSTGRGSKNVLRRKYCSNLCKVKHSKNTCNSSSKVLTQCKVCQKSFVCFISQKGSFCSQDCFHQQMHLNACAKRVERECLHCLKKFSTSNTMQRYCCQQCVHMAQTGEKVEVCCVVCKQIFLRPKHKMRRAKTRVCSRRCQWIAQSRGFIKLHSTGRRGKRVDLNDGYVYKSSFEADYARWCRHIHLEYKYEVTTFQVEINGITRMYTPDFYHPATDNFVELKGGYHVGSNLVCVQKLHEQGVKIDVIMMKDWYATLKETGLFLVIHNLENRNYGATLELIERS